MREGGREGRTEGRAITLPNAHHTRYRNLRTITSATEANGPLAANEAAAADCCRYVNRTYTGHPLSGD